MSEVKVTLTGVFVLLQGLASGVRQHLDREVDAVDRGNVIVVHTRVHLKVAEHKTLYCDSMVPYRMGALDQVNYRNENYERDSQNRK